MENTNNFNKWWFEIGSGLRPSANDDMESWSQKVAELAVKSCCNNTATQDDECVCVSPTLGSGISKCGTCNKYFKSIK